MTLPVELLQRRRPADRYDAVIVGAGMSGLLAACLLAGSGLRVVVVDRRKRAGGALQTLSHQGYAVDLAPAVWDAQSLTRALAAAGVEEPGLSEVPDGGVQVAIAGELGLVAAPRIPPLPGAVPSPSMLDAVRELLGVPPRVFAALGSVYEDLAAAAPEQLEEWRAAELGPWLAERAIEPAVRAAALRSLALLGAEAPERASVAAVAARHREGAHARLAVPGDQPIAGARGVVQSLVDRLLDAGGELRLGTRAVGLAIDARRFASVAVQREEQPFVEEIAADRCLIAVGAPQLADLLPEEPLRALAAPPSGAASALLGAAFAFEDEARFADAEQAWVVRTQPPVGADVARLPLPRAVTFVRPGASAPRLAPPGRSLLLAWTKMAAAEARDARIVLGRVGHVGSVLRALLGPQAPDLEWQRYWTAPWTDGDGFAPPTMPPVVPGFDGIYLVNADVDAPGRSAGPAAAGIAAARHAADRIRSGG